MAANRSATGSRSALTIIFGIIFLDLVGFGIVIPVLPLYAQRFGASHFVIGLLLGVYSLMQCLAAPLLGKISDRVGRKPVLLVSILGSSVGFFLMGWAATLPLLFLGRIIDGVTGGNISTAQAYIADVTPPKERSRGMGLIGAAFGLGFIFGPAIGGILSRISLAAPFLFAAGLALLNAVAVWFFLPESLPAGGHHPHRAPEPLAQVFEGRKARSLKIIVATYFFGTVAFSLLTATYPLFTEARFQFSAAQIGYLFACMGILGAIVQGGLLGWLVQVFGDKGLTVAGASILAVSFFLLPISGTLAGLLIATAGVAIGHSLTTAPLNGMASKSVGESHQGRVLGLMQSSSSFARIVGPVLGGWLLHYDAVQSAPHFGRTAYWTGGALMLIALVFSLGIQGTD